MISGSALFACCCVLYVASGGRWTLTLLATVVFIATKNNSVKESSSRQQNDQSTKFATQSSRQSPSTSSRDITTKRSPRESPVYSVDFTSSFAPDSTTVFPRKVRSRAKRAPKVIRAQKREQSLPEPVQATANFLEAQIYIFYTTLTGLSHRVAKRLHSTLLQLNGLKLTPQLLSLDDDVDDLEEYFLKTPDNGTKNLYVLVLPSYETDSPIDYFLEHLEETYNDFRVDKYPMRKLLGYAVLGLGDSELWGEESKFCYQARLTDRWMSKLGAQRVFPLGQVCMKHDGEEKAERWIDSFAELLCDEEPFYINDGVEDSDEENGEDDADTLVDVEDMGDAMRKNPDAVDTIGTTPAKEMVAQDSPTFKSLTKQGYVIVGSHSGVKICRWTKSALRGRGSCYKYAFYGIRSHLCMETTPSLACSNKCVFCWRHGTNPVAKLNWRWEVDPPEKIMAGALAGHYQKIKQMRGVPGIQMDRFEEAFRVRHCALSLVGEPIFYPHINEFVGMLHEQHISSFLVCNAQHPANLAALRKVTQLYVSIDAPTKADLKKVDRPLNSDFWERLTSCLDILRTTQLHQRTVFRLTLVKGFNMTDVESYADMVVRAQPSQIEVKGATFCGSSNGNGNPLTMQNIPFYEECKLFVEQLAAELRSRGHDYEVAAEHAHSCCILIAHTKFRVNGRWHTHIDYPRFFELLESGKEFTDLDYIKETPEWAVWGSDEAGFNPDDTRWDRKKEKEKRRKEREVAKQSIQEV